jgi:hypothetical protein
MDEPVMWQVKKAAEGAEAEKTNRPHLTSPHSGEEPYREMSQRRQRQQRAQRLFGMVFIFLRYPLRPGRIKSPGFAVQSPSMRGIWVRRFSGAVSPSWRGIGDGAERNPLGVVEGRVS